MVVCFGIVFVNEMYIVCGNHLDVMFSGQVKDYLVHLLLQLEDLAVCPLTRVADLMALDLQIIVIPPYALEPQYGLLCGSNVAGHNLLGNLSAETSGGYYQSLVILGEVCVVCTGTHIVAIHPRATYQLHEVLVSNLVLCQYNQMPSALVLLDFAQSLVATACHIHLTTEDGFEWIQPLFLAFAVHFTAIVEKILYAEHIAMVCYGHSAHSVCYGLVHKARNAGLSVQQRILGMNVEMYEVLHYVYTLRYQLRHKGMPISRSLARGMGFL